MRVRAHVALPHATVCQEVDAVLGLNRDMLWAQRLHFCPPKRNCGGETVARQQPLRLRKLFDCGVSAGLDACGSSVPLRGGERSAPAALPAAAADGRRGGEKSAPPPRRGGDRSSGESWRARRRGGDRSSAAAAVIGSATASQPLPSASFA